jgi:hypothetical protein
MQLAGCEQVHVDWVTVDQRLMPNTPLQHDAGGKVEFAVRDDAPHVGQVAAEPGP